MKLQVLAKVIFDRWWLAFIYFLVTAITGIQSIFTLSFASGVASHRQEVCKKGSGGGPLGLIVPVAVHPVRPGYLPIVERHTRGDQRQQLRRIEFSP
jgi:hypothetical protein